MLIGFYHNRLDPNKVSRAYLYSCIAKAEGAELFYFISRWVDFNKQTIKGKYYEAGRWINKEYRFPDVVINGANPRSLEQDKIKQRLQKIVPFTSYPVGSKLFVYEKILKGKKFKDNVIPYKEVISISDVFKFLKAYHKVIVKPVRGHHGDHVTLISDEGDHFLVKDNHQEMTVSYDGLRQFLMTLLNKTRLLVQKFIDCHIHNGDPYDYRLHMQKNGAGKWQITMMIPRVGSKKRVATNISLGAQMFELGKFLKNEYKDEADEVKTILEKFAYEFTEHFESLYPYEFDELGIDIGMDEFKHIWIYEVNWRPGHVFIESITAKNAVQYAIYVANKNRGKISENLKIE
jgi:glutathione synthase/RimK-type ligase-like ATP-grasp enzyme